MDNLVLYIVHTLRAMHDQSDIRKLYKAVEFISCDWSIEICHYRDRDLVSDSISVIEALASDVARRLRTHYIDNLYHIIHHAGDVVKFSLVCYGSVATATRC